MSCPFTVFLFETCKVLSIARDSLIIVGIPIGLFNLSIQKIIITDCILYDLSITLILIHSSNAADLLQLRHGDEHIVYGSSTEAPMLSRRYRLCDIRPIGIALRYTMRPLYFPREHFSTITTDDVSVTTSVRRRKIFNMLKIRTGAVTPWLPRKIATHLAQQEIYWCAEVASKMRILSVATSSSRHTDPT